MPRPLAPRGIEAGISNPNSKGTARFVREHLGRWRLYHFHDTSSSSPMKKTADVNDNRYLRPDGSNLAAFLYFLKLRHETSYSLIRRTVQRVAPFFDDFLARTAEVEPGQDPSGVAAQGVRCLLRRLIAVGWDAPLHCLGHAVSTA